MQNNHSIKLSDFPLKIEDPAAKNNRLEVLKVLSRLIMQQLNEFQLEKVEIKEQIDLVEEVQRYEADLIRCALMRTGGKQNRAARLLNLKVTTLNAKIKRLGILNGEPDYFESLFESNNKQ